MNRAWHIAKADAILVAVDDFIRENPTSDEAHSRGMDLAVIRATAHATLAAVMDE